jgi:hypothetical protein
MYQSRVNNDLTPGDPGLPADVEQTLWELFVSIGAFWELSPDCESHRSRFAGFLANRIRINPIYRDFYVVAKDVINEFKGQYADKAFEQLFTQKPRLVVPAPPQTRVEFVQQYVANEFIALHLALGGFKAFGAINYCGYFGGANIEGQPVPYRTSATQK